MKIQAFGLVKEFRRRRVVNGVSLQVEQGEVVGLLGPNGAGKTTTFYMIVGLERCTEGRIVLGDRDITDLPMHMRARLGLGYLAQEPSVFRKLTVEENILAILELRETRAAARRERCETLLGELRLAELRKRKGYMLSGGERRRVEIARALALEPRFILLDEPFTGVDPIAVADIQDIVASLKRKNLGVLITDHSVRETLAITDRAYIMHSGRILTSGPARSIASDEEARRIYLGDRFQM
ncbi:MAG: LPS export ABC transporter ATP-binding protein [Patescibacteria group bacterium]